MTLYNLALYFQVKKIHYLYFVLLNCMILLFVLIQTGHIEGLLFKNYYFHERLIIISGNLNLAAYILFSDKILNLKINHPKVAKFKKNLLPFLIFLNVPMAFGILIPVLFGIGSIMALVIYNYVIYASFMAVKRGDSSVSFFFIGNLFFYIGTTVSVLMINDVLPRSILSFTSIEVVELGNLIQLSLFSLSMGAIIKQIENKLRETEAEREFAIETANFKDQFLANMSHEIRTPLNGIIGMLDVYYASHNLNQKQKEQLGVVKTSSHSLLSIIDDILDLSKLQAGKMKISPQNTNVSELVNSTRKLFKALAEDKNLQLKVLVSEDVPQYLIIDEARIKQVINNLTSNAIKFTEKGSVSINLEIKNNQLYISVVDTGFGIEEKAKAKIFEEFAQVEETNNRRTDGTGLGLSICMKLVNLMNGQIGVTSEIGNGSTFWFTSDYEVGKTVSLPLRTPLQYKKETALNILIVEDKPVNQKVAQLMLKKLGHNSEIANNGLQCLAKFEENKYHIILMDVQMPEMDGVEAAQSLKKKYENVPPIIGLSANSMEGDAEKYISLGFDDYLAKPITLSGLKSKIDDYIPLILQRSAEN